MINASELRNVQNVAITEIITNYLNDILSPALKENALKGRYRIADDVIDIEAGIYKLLTPLFKDTGIDERKALSVGINLFEETLKKNGYKLIAEYSPSNSHNSSELVDIYIVW